MIIIVESQDQRKTGKAFRYSLFQDKVISASSIQFAHRDRSSNMAGRQRRMTLPTHPGREDPTFKAATKPCSDPQHSAAFIFVHGLGDSAEGLERRSAIVSTASLCTDYISQLLPNSFRTTTKCHG